VFETAETSGAVIGGATLADCQSSHVSGARRPLEPVGSSEDVVIGGWPLSVAAAALAAVATLSRQALVLNSVEAARPRCTCYGPGSMLGAGRVLDTLSMASPCFSAAPGRGWICWKCASDTCVRAGGEPCSRPERIPVGRCLDSSPRSSTTFNSCPGKPLPHPRQCTQTAVASCPCADPAPASHFQISGRW